MKKLLIFPLFSLLFSLPAQAESFPDVAEDYRHAQAIEFLTERGVVEGYPDGNFKPENLVNRAEAMKMITNAFKIADEELEYEAIFPDVQEKDWFFRFVMSAENNEVVDGYPDGKFRPEREVNLAETLKMTLLAGKFEVAEEVKDDLFADVKKDQWFAKYALFARDKNVIFSDDYGNLKADQAMTRGKFAEVIFRLMRVEEAGGKVYPIEENFTWFESDSLPFRMKYDAGRFEVFDRDDEVVFLRPDREFLQFAETRLYPNSAVVTVKLDDNEQELLAEKYFENLGKAFADAKLTRFDFDGHEALEVAQSNGRATDIYVYLDNGDVLAVFTEFGDGIMGAQLRNVIAAMLRTLEYHQVAAVNYDELKSAILEVILVEGKGSSLIETAGDALIIETDTIGVGTGPVDYYYSEKLDLTMKLERGKDTILDVREGRSTAF